MDRKPAYEDRGADTQGESRHAAARHPRRRPRHGYAAKEALREASGARFDLPTGTIYPALRRLESAWPAPAAARIAFGGCSAPSPAAAVASGDGGVFRCQGLGVRWRPGARRGRYKQAGAGSTRRVPGWRANRPMTYGRAWHTARQTALGPGLAATALARRPYDLRHAALSLWLNASGTPAEVSARAGNSARVLHEVYLHCTDSQDDTVSQRIEDALDAGTGITHPTPHAKASGYTHRRHHPRPCPLYVREPVPGPAHSPRPPGPPSPRHRMQTLAVTSVSADQAECEAISAEAGRCPDPAHA